MNKYDFVAYNTDITYERIAQIAKNNDISFNEAYNVVLDCSYNVTADDYTIDYLFNEYQGDADSLYSWFDSYVVDCIIEAIETGYIEKGES